MSQVFWRSIGIVNHLRSSCQKHNRSPNAISMSSSAVLSDFLLNGKTDRFNGLTISAVDVTSEIFDPDRFYGILPEYIEKWTSTGIRTVWFHVSLENSKLIPVLAENKFTFHRASYDGKIVVMCRWLCPGQSQVPPYAHTMIGVGGIVLNDGLLLAVRQTYGTRELWKLPGGYVEPGEDIDVTAVREVLEETGVNTKFDSCVLFRHTHEANFGCSDIYFVTKLTPTTTTITRDSSEVSEVMWMPVEEFLEHPMVHELNRMFVRTWLRYEKNKISIPKKEGLHPATKKPYAVYSVSE